MTPSSPSGQPIRLANDDWEVWVEPGSLRVVARPQGRSEIELSAAQPRLGRVASLKQADSQLSWSLVDSSVEVTLRLDGETLSAEITSSAPGSFTWPVIASPPTGAAYVLPLAEGSYVPADDQRWLSYLIQRSPMKALETFSMPFWGIALPDYSVTYLIANQFNNQVAFSDCGGRVGLSFTHEFAPNRKLKQYGIAVRLAGSSPIEPARQCRAWLIEQGQFVSMRTKIERTPEAAKLLGAPHIYLWEDGRTASMVEQLAALGCRPMRVGLSSAQWGFDHPELVRAVKEMGGLIAPYDSYHGIHHPEQGDSWDTAQFDAELYEKGPVQGPDGAKLPGYLGRGYQLSPLAAWPYVKQRVTRLMSELPERFNAWFVDCDAYGEVFDDYSVLHPATQEDDVRARLHRMAWIRDTYGLPIGSEGGVAYSAGTIHFAEGMMTPVFGWGDGPDEGHFLALPSRHMGFAGQPHHTPETSAAEALLPDIPLRSELPAATVSDRLPRLGGHHASLAPLEPQVRGPSGDRRAVGTALQHPAALPPEPGGVGEAWEAHRGAQRVLRSASPRAGAGSSHGFRLADG